MTLVFLTFLGSPTNFPLEFRFGFFQNESFNFYPSILQFFSALEVREISLFIRNLKMGNAVLVLDGLTIFSKDLHSVFKNDFQKMFFHYISAASRRKMVAKIVLLMQQQKGAMLHNMTQKSCLRW